MDVTSPLTINATQSLTKAMGYSKATEKIDLLYQTLFPPKSNKKSNSIRNHHLLQEYFPENYAAFPLPLQHKGLDVPKSIQEAGQVFVDNMYVSGGTYQMIQEKSKAIHKWQSPSTKTVNETAVDTIYVREVLEIAYYTKTFK